MDQKSKSDRNLVKMKLTLAAGGLIATMIGAGLLGQAESTIATASVSTPKTAITTSSGRSARTNIDAIDLPELDLNLEAIPTVSAPTISNAPIRSAPIARGRSSG